MMKKLLIISLYFFFSIFAFSEVQASVDFNLPIRFGSATLKPSKNIYDIEEKDQISEWKACGFGLTSFIGKKDTKFSFFCSFSNSFSLQSSKSSLTPKNLIDDIELKTKMYTMDFMIGPGFKFNLKENLNLNLGLGLHGYLEYSSYSSSSSSTSTDSMFFLGGGADFQFQRLYEGSKLQLVMGSRLVLDKLVNLDSDKIDSLAESMGISSFDTDGIMFSIIPYIGFGVKF